MWGEKYVEDTIIDMPTVKQSESKISSSFKILRYWSASHRENSRLLVEVDRVHHDEDLLVLVRQPR